MHHINNTSKMQKACKVFICSLFTYPEGKKKPALMRSVVLQRFGNNSRAGLTIKVLRASFNTFFLQKQTASLCTTPEVTNPLTGVNTLPPHAEVHLRTYIPHHSHPALPSHCTQYVVHPAYINCLTCGLAEAPMEAEALFLPNAEHSGHEVAPSSVTPELCPASPASISLPGWGLCVLNAVGRSSALQPWVRLRTLLRHQTVCRSVSHSTSCISAPWYLTTILQLNFLPEMSCVWLGYACLWSLLPAFSTAGQLQTDLAEMYYSQTCITNKLFENSVN